ncbi:MAG: translation initiation factor IF-2 N-terminal domain-containing protein, partial [Eubacteriales bacterium]|nr:translation initiation factor IF-2 N-terminal domain-containing protein [Eubacteriales bacterium]
MANMRVHELAKELNISTKEIIDILSNETKTYKTMSGLGEAEISQVKKKFAPVQKNAASEKEAPVKALAEHKNSVEHKAADKPEDKKSHISQVYFPQNSNDRRNGQSDKRRQDGNRSENGQSYQNRNN